MGENWKGFPYHDWVSPGAAPSPPKPSLGGEGQPGDNGCSDSERKTTYRPVDCRLPGGAGADRSGRHRHSLPLARGRPSFSGRGFLHGGRRARLISGSPAASPAQRRQRRRASLP